MTAVEQALVEVADRLEALAPKLEGLRDFQRLNLAPHTLEEVTQSIGDYSRRVDLLAASQKALQALMDDGHPDIPVREIDASSLADLKANKDTIDAALAGFASNAAVTVGLTAGKVEPKT